jgi:aminoglycoside phosphotransferase (APT) family kinase protein
LDSDNAFEALAAAAERVELDAKGAELIRVGSNAVFRFVTAPIIGRVAPNLGRLDSASRELQISRWFESAGVPAVRALHLEQPLIAHDRVVTFWQSASDTVEYGTTEELARLLTQLHSETLPIDLPAHDPVSKAAERISAIDSLAASDQEFLVQRFEVLATAYKGLSFVLPEGIIHGDANVGNVIRDRSGAAIFADLDSVAIGPREWDLILTALYHERFGWHSDAEYAAFVDAYGFDVMNWSGYQTMRDLREILMVAWLAQSIRNSRGRAEVTKRVETLRSDGSRRDWKPF